MKWYAGAMLLVLASCVRTETVRVETTPDPIQAGMKAAGNLPAQFSVVTAAGAAGDCPPRLRDPGLGTALTLRRSTMRAVPDSTGSGYRAYGDYAAEPHGQYGEETGEGLRIDCSRLRAIGIVTL